MTAISAAQGENAALREQDRTGSHEAAPRVGDLVAAGGHHRQTARRMRRTRPMARVQLDHPCQRKITMQHAYQPPIDACDACAQACDECAAACLREDDVKMMTACIRADIDCAALCRMVAGYMARG